jgi:hypothetical protein
LLRRVVEVSFTVSPRVRKIAAHNPDGLPIWEYHRQIFWGTGVADLVCAILNAENIKRSWSMVKRPPGT